MKWIQQARPNQLTPTGEWHTWLLLAGRGFGKTKTASEDIANYALWTPQRCVAVVAPTHKDLDQTCFEGESGLLKSIPEACIKKYNSVDHEIILYNGTRILGYSAEKPDRLRGPNFHRAWCDELASWRYTDAWDMLMFALRLGVNPQVVVTTTPRPTKLIKDLIKSSATQLTRGSTFENSANLAPSTLAYLTDKYANTRLGRQELHAEVLSDNPGALWTRSNIEEFRVHELPGFQRIVVAIDPAVTSKDTSDETGIIACGLGKKDKHGYVIHDVSMQGTPQEWATAAVRLYHNLRADVIVAETNNGGDMIETIIRTIDPNIPYKGVHASRGKIIRAEPISALYEQGKVHHLGLFAELEDQLCEWSPLSDAGSPDRLDALVWALTELMTENQFTGMLDYYARKQT